MKRKRSSRDSSRSHPLRRQPGRVAVEIARSARRALPKVSQEIFAEMVGTTRPRVNFFMNKFRKLGSS
jgi:hypothetical protein